MCGERFMDIHYLLAHFSLKFPCPCLCFPFMFIDTRGQGSSVKPSECYCPAHTSLRSRSLLPSCSARPTLLLWKGKISCLLHCSFFSLNLGRYLSRLEKASLSSLFPRHLASTTKFLFLYLIHQCWKIPHGHKFVHTKARKSLRLICIWPCHFPPLRQRTRACNILE